MEEINLLKDRGLNALRNLNDDIHKLDDILRAECGTAVKCPNNMYEDCKWREHRSTDKDVDVCAAYKCAIDNYRCRSGKYSYWLHISKWPGTVDGSTLDQLVEMDLAAYRTLVPHVEQYAAHEHKNIKLAITALSPGITGRVAHYGKAIIVASGTPIFSVILIAMLCVCILLLMYNLYQTLDLTSLKVANEKIYRFIDSAISI